MAIDPKKLQKPLRKLRKSLERISSSPSPDEVHHLRTQSRRVEAIMHALRLAERSSGRRLLGSIAPFRRQAGKVRDMDVLTGFASTLESEDEKDCLVQLLEELGAKRERSARKLTDTAAAHRRQARRRLARYSSLIARKFGSAKGSTAEQKEWPADAAAVALRLSSELAAWPLLKAANLHPFRLKVKELRYVLQLADPADTKFVRLLGDVKDAIGEWHDWTELESIATKVLNHGGRCRLLQEIHAIAQKQLDQGLAIATSLRRNYLPAQNKRGRRGPQAITLKVPVVITAAKLAA